MTLQELKDRKRELGYTNEMIARQTGIPLGTVQKIFAGITKAPRWNTVRTLEAFLLSSTAGALPGNNALPEKHAEQVRSGEEKTEHAPAAFGGNSIGERQTAYGDPMQGKYTLEDYLALPGERRAELIDGYIFDLASPLPLHQAMLRELFAQFYACMDSHPECELFMAPTDIILGTDQRTVVQPDLFIFCGRSENGDRMLRGAPDFITEILSPSNRFHDLFRKLNKYRFAGVREYWIVDPQEKKVIVYDLEHDGAPKVYGFEDTVDVQISEHTCSIDFRRISEKVKRYMS